MKLAQFKVYVEEGGLLETLNFPIFPGPNMVKDVRGLAHDIITKTGRPVAHIAVSFPMEKNAADAPEFLVCSATQGNWGNGNVLFADQAN